MKNSSVLKQAVGNRDTKHGLLDLPVTVGKAMKKPKMRFKTGDVVDDPLAKKPAGQVLRDWWNKKLEKEAPKEAPKAAPKEPPAPKAPGGSLLTPDTVFEFEGVKPKKKGGRIKAYASGGTVRCRDGCAVRGLTKGKMR